MINSLWTLFIKDLKLLYLREGGIIHALLLGLVLIFTFSLASSNLGPIDPVWSGAIFWICSAFCSVLIFGHLYALEEHSQTRDLLLLSPANHEMVWLSKTLAGSISLMGIQAIFIASMIVFLKVGTVSSLLKGLTMILVVDWGMGVIGSLFGALARSGEIRESFLTTILLPLQIPVMLSGIQMWTMMLQSTAGNFSSWLKLGVSFDLIFTGISMVLFPYLYRGE